MRCLSPELTVWGERGEGLRVNIKKVMLCVLHAYVSACQTISNFPRFKEQKTRFETNLEVFTCSLENRSGAEWEEKIKQELTGSQTQLAVK